MPDPSQVYSTIRQLSKDGHIKVDRDSVRRIQKVYADEVAANVFRGWHVEVQDVANVVGLNKQPADGKGALHYRVTVRRENMFQDCPDGMQSLLGLLGNEQAIQRALKLATLLDPDLAKGPTP